MVDRWKDPDADAVRRLQFDHFNKTGPQFSSLAEQMSGYGIPFEHRPVVDLPVEREPVGEIVEEKQAAVAEVISESNKGVTERLTSRVNFILRNFGRTCCSWESLEGCLELIDALDSEDVNYFEEALYRLEKTKVVLVGFACSTYASELREMFKEVESADLDWGILKCNEVYKTNARMLREDGQKLVYLKINADKHEGLSDFLKKSVLEDSDYDLSEKFAICRKILRFLIRFKDRGIEATDLTEIVKNGTTDVDVKYVNDGANCSFSLRNVLHGKGSD